MKFFAVTPSYNSGPLIHETVKSIEYALSRSPSTTLTYLVVDGASTDGSIANLSVDSPRCNFSVISERDGGMYDALVKGFSRLDGDLVFYLNAGDLLFPNAFALAEKIFSGDESVDWVTFMSVHLDEQGIPVKMKTPMPIIRKWFLYGLYGRELPHVQQENCVWRSRLMAGVNMSELRQYRYAGDFYIWACFCNQAGVKIVSVESLWAGFRKHHGQLSENVDAYRREKQKVLSTAGEHGGYFVRFIARVWALFYHLPGRYKVSLTNRYQRL